jgi:hypothetical protein
MDIAVKGGAVEPAKAWVNLLKFERFPVAHVAGLVVVTVVGDKVLLGSVEQYTIAVDTPPMVPVLVAVNPPVSWKVEPTMEVVMLLPAQAPPFWP